MVEGCFMVWEGSGREVGGQEEFGNDREAGSPTHQDDTVDSHK